MGWRNAYERGASARGGAQELALRGSQQAGERAAVVLSLIESAKLNGHDPWAVPEGRVRAAAHAQAARPGAAAAAQLAPARPCPRGGLSASRRSRVASTSAHRDRRRKAVVRGTLTLLKRRQAIEPLIGHAKADHRIDRCWLQGGVGDALHALSCAAGYNIRWLLRAIARLGPKLVLLRILQAVNGSAGNLKLHLKALTAAWDRFGAQFSADNDSGFSAIGRLRAARVA